MAKKKLVTIVDEMFGSKHSTIPSNWTSNLDFTVWKNNYKNFVKIRDLYINDDYQRPLNRNTMLRIAEHFQTVFSTPIIVDRESMEIIDGQQHAAAAYYRGDIDEIPVVYLDIPKSDDDSDHVANLAKAFMDSNALKRAITPMQKFKSAFIAKDTTVVDIENILNAHGFCCRKQTLGYVRINGPTLLLSFYNEWGKDDFDEIIAALEQFQNIQTSMNMLLNGIGQIHAWVQKWNKNNSRRKVSTLDIVVGACGHAGTNELYDKIKNVVYYYNQKPDSKSKLSAQIIGRKIQDVYNASLIKAKKTSFKDAELIQPVFK